MKHRSAHPNNKKVAVRRNVVPATDQPVNFHSHPRRVDNLTNSLVGKREELRAMRREAMAMVKKSIEELGSLDRSSRPPAAERLVSELQGALDELNSLETKVLPRPEQLFAIAERIRLLNERLPAIAVGDARPAASCKSSGDSPVRFPANVVRAGLRRRRRGGGLESTATNLSRETWTKPYIPPGPGFGGSS